MAPLRLLLRRALVLALLLGGPAALRAAPVDFDIPAQTADKALLAFSQQARVEVLFSYDELRAVRANAVHGRLEPEDALVRLLRDTGFVGRRNSLGKFVVARATPLTGAVEGRILTVGSQPARGAAVALAGTRYRTTVDDNGAFAFPAVEPGEYRLFAGGHGFRPLERGRVRVEAGRTATLEALQLEVASEVTELEPYVVKEATDRLPIGEGVGAAPRRAAGNLDLPRTEDNALPFTVFTREQITRSGVVQLNEFFQRELLDSTSNSPPPEQNGDTQGYVTGSSNLSLRGYGSDETVVLVNGRRLPETITKNTGEMGAPDVNLVPLTLVQQVEVLPVSASALYSGNAIGGVINIVLRPDAKGTELRTTYTNALDGFDAAQSSVSLQHGLTLRDGRLKLRFNATFTKTAPVMESELNYQRARLTRVQGLLPRATPNVASADDTPLFGPGTPTFTSVAPGATGTGGLAAFAGRAGVWSAEPFDLRGQLTASFNSRGYPYGREQRRMAWYGSAVYDVRPWLQLGLDASYARTVVHRGYDLFAGALTLAKDSPFNPFGQDVNVSLNEIASRFGRDYNEARIDAYSLVGGALLKLPANWQVSFDGQYSRNIARYRGLVRADADRWQQLVDAGGYNPLRDTQTQGAPAGFYDQVLVYFGAPGKFVRLGDYDTFEGTVRATNEALTLPTGPSTANFGADYRFSHLAPYTEQPRYADGTPAPEIIHWTGRTLERISIFGELQAPLVPAARLPRPFKAVEADLAARYIISAQSNETSVAPTVGLKADLVGGFAVRGSYTTSNRFPTPVMSQRIANGSDGGSGTDLVQIFDPRRNEQYDVESKVAYNTGIRAEAAATQTAGLIWQHGKTHRVRVSLDFADTTKTNEFYALEPKDVINLEAVYPDRVVRATPAPGPGPARVTTLYTGIVNVARRHSQNWNLGADYGWHGFAGGLLELRARWVWFQRYDRQLFPSTPVVDELDAPDSAPNGLLRHRVTLGAGWSNKHYGFGVDARYLGARRLPVSEWASQGSNQIGSYWQADAYVQTELTHWLPRRPPDRLRLNAQLRVNNVTNFGFPKYVNDPLGAGVQPYGDWRGRTLSVSLSAEY